MFNQMFFCFRCYSDELIGKSPEELRHIFANYSDPSCTPLRSTINIQNIQSNEINSISGNIAYLSEASSSAQCHKWIYNLDFGYQSMTTDVRYILLCGCYVYSEKKH